MPDGRDTDPLPLEARVTARERGPSRAKAAEEVLAEDPPEGEAEALLEKFERGRS